MAEGLANDAVGTLDTSIDADDLTVELGAGEGDASPFPFPLADFTIRIDDELIRIASRSGDILIVDEREVEDTFAASHTAGAAVSVELTSATLTGRIAQQLQVVTDAALLDHTLGHVGVVVADDGEYVQVAWDDDAEVWAAQPFQIYRRRPDTEPWQIVYLEQGINFSSLWNDIDSSGELAYFNTAGVSYIEGDLRGLGMARFAYGIESFLPGRSVVAADVWIDSSSDATGSAGIWFGTFGGTRQVLFFYERNSGSPRIAAYYNAGGVITLIDQVAIPAATDQWNRIKIEVEGATATCFWQGGAHLRVTVPDSIYPNANSFGLVTINALARWRNIGLWGQPQPDAMDAPQVVLMPPEPVANWGQTQDDMASQAWKYDHSQRHCTEHTLVKWLRAGLSLQVRGRLGIIYTSSPPAITSDVEVGVQLDTYERPEGSIEFAPWYDPVIADSIIESGEVLVPAAGIQLGQIDDFDTGWLDAPVAAQRIKLLRNAGWDDDADANSYNLTSMDGPAEIAAGAYLVMAVLTYRQDSTTPTKPTVTGDTLTWTEHRDLVFDSAGTDRGRLTIFRAVNPGAALPPENATIAYGGVTQGGLIVQIWQFANVDMGGANGANGIVQAADALADNDDTTIAATLAAFGSAANSTLAFLAADLAGIDGDDLDFADWVIPGAGRWDSASHEQAAGTLAGVWKDEPDTSPTIDGLNSAGEAGDGWGMTALELKRDPATLVLPDAGTYFQGRLAYLATDGRVYLISSSQGSAHAAEVLARFVREEA